ncbi:MAG TPA: arginine--tRNA ligase, partial [Gammaproteobacteria bacterium]|nr:arginine--tRNA ligase [Gammaproteobacteria bacterium]
MQSLKSYLNDLISRAMAEVTQSDACNANVITSSKPEFGDYQANGVMAEAKRRKTNPRELANQVVAALNSAESPLIEKLEVAGPGFINIFLSDTALLERANLALSEPQQLVPLTASPQRVAVDYS